MAEVRWSEGALSTLGAIVDYIRPFDSNASERTRRRLVEAASSLSHFPNRGRPAGGPFRELPTVPPYVIRYVVRDGVVTIASIRHGRRRPLA